MADSRYHHEEIRDLALRRGWSAAGSLTLRKDGRTVTVTFGRDGIVRNAVVTDPGHPPRMITGRGKLDAIRRELEL